MKTKLLFMLFVPSLLLASQFHVTTTGGTGTGASGDPWRITYALHADSAQGAAKLAAGDTIWVHGGTYSGSILCSINGSAAHPIIVRNYNDERAIIDNAAVNNNCINLQGSYTWLWGLEIFSSSLTTHNVHGVDHQGNGTKIINCIIHDMGGAGVGSWSNATGRAGSEIYGNLLYFNGRDPTLEGNYGIYAQNTNGWKRIGENIILNSFGWHQMHFYTEASHIDSLWLSGNVWHGTDVNSVLFAITGSQRILNPILDTCFVYGNGGTNVILDFGWMGTAGGIDNGIIRGSYLMRGELRLNEATAVGTSFINSFVMGVTDGFTRTDFATNTYYISPDTATGTVVAVRPNQYEAKRANIIIYNWPQADSVNVDVSTILSVNDPYTVYDAQNYFGGVVATGTYAGGNIKLPMTGLSIATPTSVLNIRSTPTHTNAQFGVFILRGAANTTPIITVGGSLTAFSTTKNIVSAEQTFTVGGSALLGDLTVTAPSTFQVSKTTSTGFASSISFTPSSGTVATSTVYVRYLPMEWGSNSGNIACASIGATTQNVSVSGSATPNRVLLKRN